MNLSLFFLPPPSPSPGDSLSWNFFPERHLYLKQPQKEIQPEPSVSLPTPYGFRGSRKPLGVMIWEDHVLLHSCCAPGAVWTWEGSWHCWASSNQQAQQGLTFRLSKALTASAGVSNRSQQFATCYSKGNMVNDLSRRNLPSSNETSGFALKWGVTVAIILNNVFHVKWNTLLLMRFWSWLQGKDLKPPWRSEVFFLVP